MPTIRTGNQEWDQNLNTLGNALFPDPSKAAQAYYYGSEARKAQIEAAKLQDQMAAGHAQLGTVFGRPANPTYRTGDFATIMNDPYAVPAAPGPTAPPAAPGQPVAPVQALPTMAATVTQTPPPAIANGIVAGAENNAQSGTLPPMAPATAVSGPEPTTTASNGSSPQNAPMNVKPGSVTSAGGGGVIMAPPGAADGTPAPAAFNMGHAVALGVAAGQTPEQAHAVALGVLGNMVKNGQMAAPLAEKIAPYYGAPSMRNQAIANEGALAVGAQTQAGETARNTARVAGENFRAQLPTTFIPDPDPVKAAQGVGRYLPLGQQQVAGGVPGTNPTAVSATVTPGQYVTPGGGITTASAGTAVAQGMPAAATSTDQNTAQTLQRIRAITDPDQRARAMTEFQATQALPKDLDPEKQAKQQAADYRSAQQVYSVPQTPVVSLGVKDPVAFDAQAQEAIDQRAWELAHKAGNQRLLGDPSKAREAAINDLQKNPTADGRRLPTPAELNAMRIPARTRIATFGLSGDERIESFVSPYNKTGQGTDHMMVRPMTPAEIQAKVAAARGEAKGAANTGGPVPTPNSTVPVPGGQTPPMSATVTAASPTQLYGGPVPGAGPAPSLGARIGQGYQAIQNIGSSGNPTPQSAAQLYGSQPAPAGAPTGPVAGGAPPGALGPAAPGLPEGAPVYGPGGMVGVNRGGWVYPPR